MNEKRYSHDTIVIVDHLKEDLIYIDGKDELLELAEYVDKLQGENEQLKNELEKLSYANEDLLEEKRIWKQMSDEYTKLSYENEQLKQQLRNSVELFRKDSVTLFELKEENKELKVNYKELRYANNIYCNKIDSLKKENEQLKQRINSRLHFYRELYESTNDNVVKRVIEDLEDILR